MNSKSGLAEITSIDLARSTGNNSKRERDPERSNYMTLAGNVQHDFSDGRIFDLIAYWDVMEIRK